MKILSLLAMIGMASGSLNIRQLRRLYPTMKLNMLRSIISQGPRPLCLEYKQRVDGLHDLHCRKGRKISADEYTRARKMNQLFRLKN